MIDITDMINMKDTIDMIDTIDRKDRIHKIERILKINMIDKIAMKDIIDIPAAMGTGPIFQAKLQLRSVFRKGFTCGGPIFPPPNIWHSINHVGRCKEP